MMKMSLLGGWDSTDVVFMAMFIERVNRQHLLVRGVGCGAISVGARRSIIQDSARDH